MLITNSTEHATISSPDTDLIGERIIKTATSDLVITGSRWSGENSEIMLQFVTSSYRAEGETGFGASWVQTCKDIELADDG